MTERSKDRILWAVVVVMIACGFYFNTWIEVTK